MFGMNGTRLAAIVATPVVAGLVLTGTAGLASASTQHHVYHAITKAHTLLTNRPDSGGNGNWANDRMERTLTIIQTGAGTFTATVQDKDGSFTTISHAYTPNQGTPFTGDLISHRVTGRMAGEATYSFTADKAPNAHLVPRHENGAPVTAAQSTSFWFEQAFPVGTTFGGAGINNNWSWDYAAKVTVTKYHYVTVYRHGHKVHVLAPYRVTKIQRWDDSASNNGGQVLAAGNITG